MTMFPEFAHAANPELSLEPRILRAVSQIKGDYGDDASVIRKNKILQKFGRSTSVDSSSLRTVWAGDVLNDENPLFGDPALGNTLDTIVSTAADTNTVVVEGHTKSGDDLTFVVQTVTLTGTTEKALTTPLHDCTRVYNNSATPMTGAISVFDNADGSVAGVPNDPTDIGNYVTAGDQQGQSAYTAVSSQDYWIVTTVKLAINRAQSASVDVVFEKRSTTGVWLPLHIRPAINTTGSSTILIDLDPVIIIPKNNYVRVRAEGSSATDTTVSAAIAGFLALVV